jgi:catechol 2,3-dioxygenase-like lactoylglutathione lyase family enzyme
MIERWPQFAIPSYHRAMICQERTLATLEALEVPRENITIFVADPNEYVFYKNACDPKRYHKIVIAEKGMGAVRRFIARYYPEGQRVVSVDDDISGFYRKLNDKKYLPMTPEEFHGMVKLGFWACQEANCRLWGIYPVLNALFMNRRVRVGLTYIVGAFWGVVNTHEYDLQVTLDDKEDFERTLKFFQADGAVVRLEAYSLKTSYYNTPGGMQIDRTPERIDASARELVRRYPLLAKLNTTKKSGHTEVRLIDPRGKKVLT